MGDGIFREVILETAFLREPFVNTLHALNLHQREPVLMVEAMRRCQDVPLVDNATTASILDPQRLLLAAAALFGRSLVAQECHVGKLTRQSVCATKYIETARSSTTVTLARLPSTQVLCSRSSK